MIRITKPYLSHYKELQGQSDRINQKVHNGFKTKGPLGFLLIYNCNTGYSPGNESMTPWGALKCFPSEMPAMHTLIQYNTIETQIYWSTTLGNLTTALDIHLEMKTWLPWVHCSAFHLRWQPYIPHTIQYNYQGSIATQIYWSG